MKEQEVLEVVPRTQIQPSATNPRKDFNYAKLEELAASIKVEGILQPLVVREVSTKSLMDQPRFEIVAGERRWRAAEIAGLDEVPVIVRELSDEQVFRVQLIENLQRENLSALEEADSYQKEIESGRHTAESLHKALGISRATLFSRLALTRLHPPVRQALVAGKISVSVAGLVAMVPEVKRQEELLKEVTEEDFDGEVMSFRAVQQLIEEEYCRQLKGAPFDWKKEYVGEFKPDGPKGGGVTVMLFHRGSCEKCRYRSENIEGCAIKNSMVCTQPKCFEAKTEAAWKEVRLEAAKNGQRTIDVEQWQKVRGQYVKPDESASEIGRYDDTWKDLVGKQPIKPVLVQQDCGEAGAGFITVWAKEEAKEAAKANGTKITERSCSSGDNDYAEQEKKRKAKQALLLAAGEKALGVLLEKVKAAPANDIKLWRLLANDLCYTTNFLKRHNIEAKGNLRRSASQYVAKLSEPELRAAIVEAFMCGDLVGYYDTKFNDGFTAVCEAYKVNLEGFITIEKNLAKKDASASAKVKGKAKAKA